MKRSMSIGMIASVILAGLLLQGCKHDQPRTFAVTVTNLTDNQPFSPLAAVTHEIVYQGVSVGVSASDGLERLAESGDNSAFLAEADADSNVEMSVSGSGLILPGETEDLVLYAKKNAYLLSLASMLVNTNDGIVVIDGMDLGNLKPGEKVFYFAAAYDAGTEGNSEAMSDIPGPAGGGEGYNADRDDRNVVAVHAGVIGNEDGLPGSVLSNSHRFDNPVARVVVTRID